MGERTIEIYADTRGPGVCRGKDCGRRILWAEVVRTGKKMCFNDPEEVALSTRHEPSSGRLIEALEFSHNHWASCPNANGFAQRGPAPRSSALAVLFLLLFASSALASNTLTSRPEEKRSGEIVTSPQDPWICAGTPATQDKVTYQTWIPARGVLPNIGWCQETAAADTTENIAFAINLNGVQNYPLPTSEISCAQESATDTLRMWKCTAKVPDALATLLRSTGKPTSIAILQISNAPKADLSKTQFSAGVQLTTITGCLNADGVTVSPIGTPYALRSNVMTVAQVADLRQKMMANGWRFEWQRVPVAKAGDVGFGFWYIVGDCKGGPQ
jgi:hypothetical protein